MPVTQAELFAALDRIGVTHHTIAHQPVFRHEDGGEVEKLVPGLHCKNLFLKDAKGRIWLVVMPGALRADLKFLDKAIGSARLSFGKPELLLEVLGISPGSVTPFALLNDRDHRVTVVLDSAMMAAESVNYHPLRNDQSTVITPAGLQLFLAALHYTPLIVDCVAPLEPPLS